MSKNKFYEQLIGCEGKVAKILVVTPFSKKEFVGQIRGIHYNSPNPLILMTKTHKILITQYHAKVMKMVDEIEKTQVIQKTLTSHRGMILSL